VISPSVLAHVPTEEGPCRAAPTDLGAFSDAWDYILHERESISGGVCVGGPDQLTHLAWHHMEVSIVAVAAAILIAVIYILINSTLTSFASWLERRTQRRGVRPARAGTTRLETIEPQG
jgi:hypothetical protein